MNRRHFLRTNVAAAAVAAAFPTIIPSSVLGENAPSKRVNLGCIGVGPQGRGDMSNFLAQPDCRVVALCDVAKRNLDEAVKMVNNAYKDTSVATHHDFADLLARKDVDAVLIATPDHWHVPLSLGAVNAGKDIYLEKPMGLDIYEDQLLRKMCRQKERIFQFGTQQRSGQQFRLACELVRNGRIGRLKQINCWCSASRPGGSTAPIDPPADLDYDLWLGPAYNKPYTLGKAYDEGGAWKTWWFNADYALGFVAGWGVHPLDIAYWGHPAMMLRGPVEVSGQGVIPTTGACNTAVAWDVNFSFAGDVRMSFRGTRNGADAMPMNDLSAWEKKYTKIVDHGTAFEGTDGWVLVDRSQIRTSPENLIEEKFTRKEDVRLIQSSNHARNFLDSVKSRQPAICPIEDAVQADILCHLSNFAIKLKRPLKWDPVKERFIGDVEANQLMIVRPLRKPPAGRQLPK